MPYKFNPFTGTLDDSTPGSVGSLNDGSAGTPSIRFLNSASTGIYLPGANQVGVATNGTEKLIVLSNGNVGIGTSVPNYQLHATTSFAVGAAGFNQQLLFTNDTIQSLILGTGYTPLKLNPLGGNVGIGTSSPSSLAHIAGGGTGRRGALRFSDAGGANYWEIGRDNGVNGGFTFTQNGTERLCIDYLAGNVGIGTNSPAHQLQVSTDSAGKPSTNTWTIVSDERIKEEIELADLDLCYQAVKNIPLKRFKWKDEVYTEKQVKDRRKLGWIAQDVEAVFPKAVGTYEFKYNQVFEETIIPAVEEVLDDEGNVTTPAQPERIEKGELISEDVIEDCRDLNSDQLYAAMYGAIQKLMLKVETLETELATLKAS